MHDLQYEFARLWLRGVRSEIGHAACATCHKGIESQRVRPYIRQMELQDYERWMALALREAELAAEEREVPVGAVVIQHGRVIGRGHNRTIALHDATAHAEMIALTAAFEYVGDWRLEDCLLVSTLEPCAMCAGAAVLSRIKAIIYGAKDVRFGGCETLFTIPTDSRLNHRCELVGGVGQEESAAMLRSFFQQVRQTKD